MVLFFPTNMILPFCQKSKDNPKNVHLKIMFLVILKKMIFISQNWYFF